MIPLQLKNSMILKDCKCTYTERSYKSVTNIEHFIQIKQLWIRTLPVKLHFHVMLMAVAREMKTEI